MVEDAKDMLSLRLRYIESNVGDLRDLNCVCESYCVLGGVQGRVVAGMHGM